MKLYFAIFLILFLLSCSAKISNSHSKQNQALAHDEKVIWVNSFAQPCMGMTPMRCLQVQENDSFIEDAWLNFYDEIEGFAYKPGARQKLIIKEIQIKASEVPADASSIKRILVKVIDSTLIPNEQLDGRWIPTEVIGISSNETSNFSGYIEIYGDKLRGTDGCNQLNSSLIKESFATLK